MSYKRLFVFLEGDDDARFFKNSGILSYLYNYFDDVAIWPYAQESNKKIKQFIDTINQVNDWNYLYVADIDEEPCVTSKKKKIITDKTFLDQKKVLIIIKEIESWYLAGLDSKSCKKLGIRECLDTNKITKEILNKIIEKHYGSKIQFLIDSLNFFNIKTAIIKNKSFDYFYKLALISKSTS